MLSFPGAATTPGVFGSTVVFDGASTSITRPGPLAVGDRMFMFVGGDSTSSPLTTPSGWTLVDTVGQPSSIASTVALYTKVVADAEPGGYVLNNPGGRYIAVIGVYPGFSGTARDTDGATQYSSSPGSTFPLGAISQVVGDLILAVGFVRNKTVSGIPVGNASTPFVPPSPLANKVAYAFDGSDAIPEGGFWVGVGTAASTGTYTPGTVSFTNNIATPTSSSLLASFPPA